MNTKHSRIAAVSDIRPSMILQSHSVASHVATMVLPKGTSTISLGGREEAHYV